MYGKTNKPKVMSEEERQRIEEERQIEHDNERKKIIEQQNTAKILSLKKRDLHYEESRINTAQLHKENTLQEIRRDEEAVQEIREKDIKKDMRDIKSREIEIRRLYEQIKNKNQEAEQIEKNINAKKRKLKFEESSIMESEARVRALEECIEKLEKRE